MISERRIEVIWAVCAALPLVSLSIIPRWTAICTIPLLLCFLFLIAVKRTGMRYTPMGIVMTLFYLTYVVWALISNQDGLSSRELEYKMMFALAPLLFSPRQKGDTRVFMVVLILAVLTALLFSIGKALECMDTDGRYFCWYSSLFSYVMHPTYQMVYAFVAAIGVVWMAMRSSKWYAMLLWLLLLGPIFWFIRHLAADAVLLCAMSLGVLVLFIPFRRLSRKSLAVIGALVAVVGVIAITYLNRSVDAHKQNFSMFFEYVEDPATFTAGIKDSSNGNQMRLMVWYASSELIKENPMGIGPDRAKAQMLESYAQHGFSEPLKHELNSHNQFIQVWLSVGPIGFILLLSVFFMAIVKGIRTGRWMLTFFALMIFTNCLVENMLEVQAGTVFFCLVLMVLERWEPIAFEEASPWWRRRSVDQ